MFEFATLLCVGKIVAHRQDKDGGAIIKLRVGRKGATGKFNKSIFLLKCTKAAWAYYSKFVRVGMEASIQADLFRSEFRDEHDQYGERVFGKILYMNEVREIAEMPVENEDTEIHDTGTSAKAVSPHSIGAGHKFTFDDATIPDNGGGYSPF